MGENWNSNDYESFNNYSYDGDSFGEDEFWNDTLDDHDKYLEQRVLRLQQAVAQGRTEVRTELIEALLNWIDVLSFHQRHPDIVNAYKELIGLYADAINDGQFEYAEPLGKTYLQYAVKITELDPEWNYCAEYQKAISSLYDLVYSGNLHCRSDLAAAYMYFSDYQRKKRFSINVALSNAEQAIEIWRTLIEEGDLQQRSLLAAALISKGVVLREIGDCDETMAAFKEAEAIQRDLLCEAQEKEDDNDNEIDLCCDEDDEIEEEKENPAIELLRCLILQAETLAHFQRFVQAHLLFDEAIEFCRAFEKTRPDFICVWLPILLVDKARIYRECWQFSAALKVYEDAIDEYEKIRFFEIRNLNWSDFSIEYPDDSTEKTGEIRDFENGDFENIESHEKDRDSDGHFTLLNSPSWQDFDFLQSLTKEECELIIGKDSDETMIGNADIGNADADDALTENGNFDEMQACADWEDVREFLLVDENKFEEKKELFAETFDRTFRETAKDFAKVRNCPSFIRENWDDYIDLQIAHIHSCRGCLFHDLERFECSVSTFDEALAYYQEVEYRGKVDVGLDICLVQLNRAKSLLAAKQPAEALVIQENAIWNLRQFITDHGQENLRVNLAQALRELAVSLGVLGHYVEAFRRIDESIELWRDIIDEGKLENREQLAHSLLVRSDFLMEKEEFDRSLQGYLESYHIRKDLFSEGDWLVALPMVQTLFNLAKNYYFLKDDQEALFWNIEALDVLEKVRRRRLICVDAYILEGTRRCMGILLNIQNPDVVLKEIEKIFYFIEQIQNDEQSRTAIELMLPYFQVYKALAWKMKGCVAEEIQSLLGAIDAWEYLLKKDGSTQSGQPLQEIREKRIEYLTELDQALAYLAEAYAEQGRTSPELQVHRKRKTVFEQLQALGVEVSKEKRLANLQRIARISRKKV